MTALYNEIEPYPAKWLENLITAGAIAPGKVAQCDLRTLTADDVAGYTQFHTFAGIGIWQYALQLAGWPNDLSVWTGSCPCQPWSIAGNRKGLDDERHLWPAWFKLIRECRPACIFGEQVASKDGLQWLDLVSADLETAGYAVGALDIPAASVGAPHQRQRLYLVAYSIDQRRDWLDTLLRTTAARRDTGEILEATGGGEAHSFPMANAQRNRLQGALNTLPRQGTSPVGRGSTDGGASGGEVGHGALGNTSSPRGGRDTGAVSSSQGEGPSQRQSARGVADELVTAGPVGGFWADAEWLPCTDGKWRCTRPGAQPLVAGSTYDMDPDSPPRSKVLYSSGNALVAPLAASFIAAFLDTCFDAAR